MNDEIKRMSGNRSIAAAVGSDLQGPLWPSSVNWPSGSFRSTAVVRMTAPKGWRPAAIGRFRLLPMLEERSAYESGPLHCAVQ